MVNLDREMEEIAKLYSFMSDEDKEKWSIGDAEAMYLSGSRNIHKNGNSGA